MLSDAAAAAAVAEADIPVSSSSPLSASPSLSPSPASSSSFFSQQPATLVALRAHVQHRFRRAVASSVAASLAELSFRVADEVRPRPTIPILPKDAESPESYGALP